LPAKRLGHRDRGNLAPVFPGNVETLIDPDLGYRRTISWNKYVLVHDFPSWIYVKLNRVSHAYKSHIVAELHLKFDPVAVVDCARLEWSPQIGDPTFAGWLTVAAYAVCALLGLRVAARLGNGREKAFWALTTIAMLFLCINKQLDLQSLLTAVGRCVSQLQGWYEQRRTFQRDFILGLLALAALFLALLAWLVRGHLRRNGLAVLGLAIVTAFVVFRAVGFYHFYAALDGHEADAGYKAIFELSGLILISANAFTRAKAGN
jgi:hypothetical protein